MQFIYSLDEVRECSSAIVNNSKAESNFDASLVDAAKYAWAYVCKFSDTKSSLKRIGGLWDAAYVNILYNRTDLKTQK